MKMRNTQCSIRRHRRRRHPRHAHKRSANSYGKAFRLNVEGCDPRYSFHHIGTDGSLYVFEAPIDMLSYITLHPEDWQRHSYVACCGTSIQPVVKMLERKPQIHTILLCLDNDEAVTWPTSA